ncbi:hypothetical protein [Desulfonema magnum]|uniref:Mce/MlaD domain-containing protein n=1 Tax=Desulfonema magnum TaxID=45655 RepID=A0A975BG29_9BACT|nr:hypothetical protein [Desulfonema magnum]QTA84635.1 Uncharacterized protein dnm_006340 [Desulfonema magnum]
MVKKILILTALSLLFLGCEDGLRLKIRYDQIQGLKQGDRVFFENNHIGNVTDVVYTADGDYLASVAIRKDFANAATEHSKFYIITDPRDNEKKAIEINLSQKDGEPLQDGAVIDGSTRALAFFDQVLGKFDKGVETLKNGFDQFLEDLSGVPESEDFKALEKELDELAEDMKQSGKSVQEKIRKEVLPKLKEELDKLREELRKFGREKELDPLEDKIKKIKKEV